MTIDELLCKFQGLHWHKGITYPDGAQSRYKCSCMEHQSIDPLSSLNPDFSAAYALPKRTASAPSRKGIIAPARFGLSGRGRGNENKD